MNLTRTEATELGLRMTAKEIATHLTGVNNIPVTEAWVKSAFKQMSIQTKSLRKRNPIVIVEDAVASYASNSDDLDVEQQQELYANNN